MTTHVSPIDAPPPVASNDRLLVTVFLAAIVHAAIILGVNFTPPEPEKIDKAIDITLVNIPDETPPEKARFLAPEHQEGAGEKVTEPKPLEKKLPKPESSPVRKPVVARQHEEAPSEATPAPPPVEAEEEPEPHPEITPEALAMQIAQLGAEIRNKAQGAEQTRIKFIDSVSAHKYLAAQYIHDWQTKVERTGNLNYPEVARKKGFTGKLTMDVGIKADGSVYSMRITRSSGYPALDEAAKRIVRMSAPFAPLPTELLKEIDVLVISRIWTFSDESGMTSGTH
jgi:protein TonB